MPKPYEQELPRLRKNITAVIDTYASYRGVSTPTVMKEVVGSTAPQVAYFPDSDIRAGKYDEWMQAFSDKWPGDYTWPADVPRPARSADAA